MIRVIVIWSFIEERIKTHLNYKHLVSLKKSSNFLFFIFYPYSKRKWIDQGIDGVDARGGDDDDASTTSIMVKIVIVTRLTMVKDYVNNQREKKES